jgi:hypothetical protein
MGYSTGGVEHQPGYRGEPSDEEVDALIHERGEMTFDEIGEVFGFTRQRAKQLFSQALEKALRVCQRRDISPADYPQRETVWDRLQL